MLSPLIRLRVPALFIVVALLISPRAAADDVHHPEAAAKHDDHGAKHNGQGGGHGAHKEPSPIDHVMDSDYIHLFDTPGWPHGIPLPRIPLGGGRYFQITKFMVLEVLSALIIIAIYLPLAKRIAPGGPPSGVHDNLFEVLLVFIRDQIAKPNLGEDQADRYVPFLWTLFLFVLVNNLLGMFPFLGSATASIYVTIGLAILVFFAIHGSAILTMGAADYGHGHGHGDGHGHDHGHGHGDAHAAHGHHDHGLAAGARPSLAKGTARYLHSMWPQIDVPFVMGLFIKPLVFMIEVVGILVRNAVLAVRLFANMFAGHMVMATILLFIKMAANLSPGLWGTIAFSSVLGILALSLLELFVAFLQAYIFTFLASLFMGMAITPQH